MVEENNCSLESRIFVIGADMESRTAEEIALNAVKRILEIMDELKNRDLTN